MNNSRVDFGAAFQFAMLTNNLKFAAKKQYFAKVYEKNETITQKQTIQIYCTLFTQLNAALVQKSFDEAIFNEKNSVASSENDPRPVNLNAKEKSIVDDADDENDDDDEEQEQEEAEVMMSSLQTNSQMKKVTKKTKKLQLKSQATEAPKCSKCRLQSTSSSNYLEVKTCTN
jgi:hypothetical protein